MRKNYNNGWLTPALLIFISVFWILLPPKGYSASDQLVYNLGVIIPDTGNMAFLGDPVKNGFLLAQEDWKQELAAKNITINLIFGDSQGNPKTAVSIYNQNKAIKKHPWPFCLSGRSDIGLEAYRRAG